MSAPLDVSVLDDGGRRALRRLITTLADSKRLMGIRYSDWLLGSPSIETGIATSSMAQDEWGHARLLYAMLKELGDDPVAAEHDRPADEYANISALDEPFPDWAAVVSGMVMVDGALTVAMASFAEGAFEPASSRWPKMIAEEAFHASLGAAWFRRLAESSSSEARDLLRFAVDRQLPVALQWLGLDDDASSAMVDAGVIRPAEERVEPYREAVRDLAALVGVDVDEGVGDPPSWDAARGRAQGHPDEEAVERARGDRNRALFVE